MALTPEQAHFWRGYHTITSRDDVELLLVIVGPVDGGKAPPIAYVVESDGMSRPLKARAGVGRQQRLPQTQGADHVMEYRILHASLSLFKGGIYRYDGPKEFDRVLLRSAPHQGFPWWLGRRQSMRLPSSVQVLG